MFDHVSKNRIPVFVTEENHVPLSCEGCRNGIELDFDFTMAFQPIVDVNAKTVTGYEALVRGINNEPAFTIIDKVTEENLYKFDQTCRVKAIALAAQHKLTKRLNINFLPGAVYKPEVCIQTTLNAAQKYGFPKEMITFEIVETEMVTDKQHLAEIISYYKSIGFKTALDDFGTGYSNLDALAELSPDKVKLDLCLIKDLHSNLRKQKIVRRMTQLLQELDVEVLAEGVETREDRDILLSLGISRQQGYFFGKPALERFEEVSAEKFS